MEPDWGRLRELIKSEEGFVPFAYDDADSRRPMRKVLRTEAVLDGWRYRVLATGGTVTVGYGDVRPHVVDRYWDGITPKEAEAVLDEVLDAYWTNGVQRWLTRPLATPLQGVALTSFAYNAGVNALPIEGDGQGYTTAPGLLRALNDGRWAEAAALLARSFLKKPGFDLTNRRRREAALFLEPWVPPYGWASLLPLVAA